MAHFCKVPEGTKISSLKDTTVTTEGCIYLVMKEDNYCGVSRNLTFMSKNKEDAIEYAHDYGGKLFWSTKENWKEYNWLRVLNTNYIFRDFDKVGFASNIPVGGYGITLDYDVVVHCNEGFLYWNNDDKFVLDTCAPNVLVAYTTNLNREESDRTLKENNIWITIRHGIYALVKPIGSLTGVNARALNNSRFKAGCNIMRIPSTFENSKLLPWAECYPFDTYDMSYRSIVGPLSFEIKNDEPYVTCDMAAVNRYGIKEKISVPLTKVPMTASMTFACGVCYSYFNFSTSLDGSGDIFDPLSERWCNVFSVGHDGRMCSSSSFPDSVNKYLINIDGKLVSRFTVLLRRDNEDRNYYTVLDGCDGKNFFSCDTTCDMEFYVDGDYKRCTWDESRSVFILYEDTVKAFCRSNNIDYDGWGNGGYVYDRELITCPTCGKKYIKLSTHDSLYSIAGYDEDGDFVRKHPICPNCFKQFRDFSQPIHIGDKTIYRTEYEVHSNYIVAKSDLIWDDEGELFLKDNLLEWDFDNNDWKIPNGRVLIPGPRGIQQLHEKYCCHVSSYSYKPVPIFCKGETEETEKFFGVELELMNGGESDHNVAKICKDLPFVYAKHDGSLDDGVELVSHPCTLAYHKNEFGWDKILERAKDLGYNTPSGSGIHIHLSKAFWRKQDKESMIAFIITFCDLHREALRIFANRDSYEFDRWTKCYMSKISTEAAVERVFGDYDTIKDISASLYRGYSRATCHYSGVNLSNSDTVEFRFFHSSTSYTRLIGILQFIDCLSDMSINVTKETMIDFERIKEYATSKGYTELLNNPCFIDACEYDKKHPVKLNLGK